MKRSLFRSLISALALALLVGCGQPHSQRAALGADARYATETTPGTRAPRDAADPAPVPSPTAPVE